MASFTIVIGMWLERFLIIVPTLANPRLPFIRGGYTPRWVEVTITIGTFAYFALLYVLFTKLFPIISMWELKEGYQVPAAHRGRGASGRPIARFGKGGDMSAPGVSFRCSSVEEARRVVSLLRSRDISPETSRFSHPSRSMT